MLLITRRSTFSNSPMKPPTYKVCRCRMTRSADFSSAAIPNYQILGSNVDHGLMMARIANRPRQQGVANQNRAPCPACLEALDQARPEHGEPELTMELLFAPSLQSFLAYVSVLGLWNSGN